jgi:hypothetical protein
VAPSRYRCTLVTPDGSARRVDARGLVIGRHAAADIVIDDPSVSRQHALVRYVSDGVELVPIGRIGVVHNDRPCERSQPLVDGDRVRIADLVFTVRVELPPPANTTSGYRLVRKGTIYGISHTPFVVGGGAADDLILEKLPPSAMHLHLARDELFVEMTVAGARRSGVVLEVGMIEPVDVGEAIEYADERFVIDRRDRPEATTLVHAARALPSRIVVEMLARGGRVTFTLAGSDYTVYLAERRLDLIIALVRPPANYSPGEFVPDDVLAPIVWPRRPEIIRSDINLHITRCRRDLLAVGLPGPNLIERAPTGGATRLAIRPDCEIVFGG